MNDAFEAFDLSGRTAVIAGASSDIGVAVALRLAAAGANVALGDIDESRMETTEATLAKGETGVLSLRTDVTRRAELEALPLEDRHQQATEDVPDQRRGVELVTQRGAEAQAGVVTRHRLAHRRVRGHQPPVGRREIGSAKQQLGR